MQLLLLLPTDSQLHWRNYMMTVYVCLGAEQRFTELHYAVHLDAETQRTSTPEPSVAKPLNLRAQ